MNKIPIVITSYNRRDMLEECINSIRQYTNPDHYELVLINNGSDSETTNFINLQKDKKDVLGIMHFSKNMGFAGGYSAGLREVKDRDYMIVVNNDTKVSLHWFDHILTTIEKNKDDNLGLILPYTNNCCNPGIVVENSNVETKDMKIEGNVPAVCWVISKKCYENVCRIIELLGGGNSFFHSDFKIGWAEDILTSEILSRLGYSKYASGGSFIYHAGSATQNILKTVEDYRAQNMVKLGKYLELLNKLDLNKVLS